MHLCVSCLAESGCGQQGSCLQQQSIGHLNSNWSGRSARPAVCMNASGQDRHQCWIQDLLHSSLNCMIQGTFKLACKQLMDHLLKPAFISASLAQSASILCLIGGIPPIQNFQDTESFKQHKGRYRWWMQVRAVCPTTAGPKKASCSQSPGHTSLELTYVLSVSLGLPQVQVWHILLMKSGFFRLPTLLCSSCQMNCGSLDVRGAAAFTG